MYWTRRINRKTIQMVEEITLQTEDLCTGHQQTSTLLKHLGARRWRISLWRSLASSMTYSITLNISGELQYPRKNCYDFTFQNVPVVGQCFPAESLLFSKVFKSLSDRLFLKHKHLQWKWRGKKHIQQKHIAFVFLCPSLHTTVLHSCIWWWKMIC